MQCVSAGWSFPWGLRVRLRFANKLPHCFSLLLPPLLPLLLLSLQRVSAVSSFLWGLRVRLCFSNTL
jgi:hypothetical protein